MQLFHKGLCIPVIITASLGLSACGGSDSSGDKTQQPITGTPTLKWTQGQFDDYASFANQCAADQTGSALAEKLWLRSWSNDTYLWYDEIFDRDPAPYSVADYFELLRTEELSDTGNPKDQYHFQMSTVEWEQLSESGASVGYGFNLHLRNAAPGVSRQVTIAYTDPNTPASYANISRGAIIVAIDGVNVANANDSASIDVLNNGLFPSAAGTPVTFTIRDLNAATDREVTLTAKTVVSTPVQNTKVIDTANGKVGYLQFNSHIATAERGLFDAMTSLSEAGIDDLVLDLRYNGGGLLALASQLGYMIAGADATNNKVFERTSFNDKYPNTNPVTGEALTPMPFIPESIGFNPSLLSAGMALPTLNLDRVYVLTTDNTCSASEALMNSLRGIDIEVIQLGSTTCGKPYGFYPTPNCDMTYFTIQFKGVNDKGFGDYSDGFVPSFNPTLDSEIMGCQLEDDFNHALGDSNERLLSAALYYRDNNQCPAVAMASSRKRVQAQFVDEGFMLQDTRQQNLLNTNRIVTMGETK
ncbi:S41 family peptidase [Shewanella aestuarii]|uniref:Peptidase n=1 Tax=Shewanella aestuarii TaxID=1028752 RepID=A0A6G9QGX6_9GAMM|nr:S41 family peptidase [Shewanella aestuarii]QIR13423.1 peptidase [Shewanella aestuarii]